MKINSIQSNNFKGVYISNSLNPGLQHELAKDLFQFLVKSGISDKFEHEGKDILLTKANEEGVSVVITPLKIQRLLDDNFTRWSGRLDN